MSTVELPVTVNSITILSVTQQCFHDKLCGRQSKEYRGLQVQSGTGDYRYSLVQRTTGTVWYRGLQVQSGTRDYRHSLVHGTAGIVSYTGLQVHSGTEDHRYSLVQRTTGTVWYTGLQVQSRTRDCRYSLYTGLRVQSRARDCRYSLVHRTAGTVSYTGLQVESRTRDCRYSLVHGTAGTVSYTGLQVQSRTQNYSYSLRYCIRSKEYSCAHGFSYTYNLAEQIVMTDKALGRFSILNRVRKTVKSDYKLRHVCMSVCRHGTTVRGTYSKGHLQ